MNRVEQKFRLVREKKIRVEQKFHLVDEKKRSGWCKNFKIVKRSCSFNRYYRVMCFFDRKVRVIEINIKVNSLVK